MSTVRKPTPGIITAVRIVGRASAGPLKSTPSLLFTLP